MLRDFLASLHAGVLRIHLRVCHECSRTYLDECAAFLLAMAAVTKFGLAAAFFAALIMQCLRFAAFGTDHWKCLQ